MNDFDVVDIFLFLILILPIIYAIYLLYCMIVQDIRSEWSLAIRRRQLAKERQEREIEWQKRGERRKQLEKEFIERTRNKAEEFAKQMGLWKWDDKEDE